MKSTLNFDYFMIGLGLATLVVQWSLYRGEKKEEQQRAQQYIAVNSSAQVVQVREPEYILTFPEGSPYQDLFWADSTQPNPFLQVQQISQANAGDPNWAGKDTDMKLLLEAH